MAIVDVRRLSPMERVWAANILRSVGETLPTSGDFDTNRLRRTILWKQIDTQREHFVTQYAGPFNKVLEELGSQSSSIYERTSSVTSVVNHVTQTLPAKIRPIMRALYANVGKYFAQRVVVNTPKAAGGEFDPFSDPNMSQWFTATVGAKITNVAATTSSEIRNLVQREIAAGSDIPTIARKLRDMYGFSKSRSIRIARTEVIAASNAGNFFGALANIGTNLVKVWMATQDDRTRDSHKSVDGQKQSVEKPFSVNGSELLFPGDTSLDADPEETIQCRCTMYFERPEGYVSPADIPDTPPPAGDTPEEVRRRILAETDDAQARMRALQNQLSETNREFYKLIKKQYSPEGLTVAESEQYVLLKKRVAELTDNVSSLRRALDNVVEQLFQDKAGYVRFSVYENAYATATVKRRIENAFKIFNKLVGDRARLISNVNVGVSKRGSRAYAVYNADRIVVAANDQIGVIIHELGHVLEDNDSRLKADIVALVARRTKGEPLVPLSSLFPKHGYDPSEVTRVDKWIHPYMGRVYERGSTEVVSLGLQLMYNDPLSLMRKDPELFDILYTALRRPR